MYFNVIHDLDNPGTSHMIELYKDELTYKR